MFNPAAALETYSLVREYTPAAAAPVSTVLKSSFDVMDTPAAPGTRIADEETRYAMAAYYERVHRVLVTNAAASCDEFFYLFAMINKGGDSVTAAAIKATPNNNPDNYPLTFALVSPAASCALAGAILNPQGETKRYGRFNPSTNKDVPAIVNAAAAVLAPSSIDEYVTSASLRAAARAKNGTDNAGHELEIVAPQIIAKMFGVSPSELIEAPIASCDSVGTASPDLCFVINGRRVFIQVKARKGSLLEVGGSSFIDGIQH